MQRNTAFVGELLYQNMGGVCWGHNEVIKPFPMYPNSHVISLRAPGRGQFHFNTEGNRLFKIRYAEDATLLVLDNNDIRNQH